MAAQSAAARKAWNEAMKATAGATALPPALQQRTQKRRSDRHKKQERRAKARRGLQSVGGLEGEEEEEYRAAVWVDALEGVDPSAPTVDDDDDYDELAELDQEQSRGSGKNKKRKRGRGGASSKKTAGVLPKKFLPRTLASILMEEANRPDGKAREFLNAEARVPKNTVDKHGPLPPRRKFCPVTGMEGIYIEPKTNIPYATYRALEQIRERPPPWMMLATSSGASSAAYWEASKSLRG